MIFSWRDQVRPILQCVVAGSKYYHKVHLEDFWENVVNENEIGKKMHSRLPLNIIRICNIVRVLDKMEEDSNVMQK